MLTTPMNYITLLVTLLFLASCAHDTQIYGHSAPRQVYEGRGIHNAQYVTNHTASTLPPIKVRDQHKVNDLYKTTRTKVQILSRYSKARTRKAMTPRYITIHSTQNTSVTADAYQHAAALSNGSLGRKSWHYTIDEDRCIQHIPSYEQGNHAENYKGGTGNIYSLGLEMCENRGNSRSRTIDRTARLTAYLMHKHGIPINNVVPHYHWKRKSRTQPHKDCPHFLLDNGRPGRKWYAFQRLVDSYYQQGFTYKPATLAYNSGQ